MNPQLPAIPCTLPGPMLTSSILDSRPQSREPRLQIPASIPGAPNSRPQIQGPAPQRFRSQAPDPLCASSRRVSLDCLRSFNIFTDRSSLAQYLFAFWSWLVLDPKCGSSRLRSPHVLQGSAVARSICMFCRVPQ